MPETFCLNGIWKADFEGGPAGIDIPVPGCWENSIDRKDIQGPVRIYRTFSISAQRYEKAFLHFNAVSYFCEVYVNGRKTGEHEGLWDGFRIDITEAVIPHGDNTVELLVWKPGYKPQDRFPLRQVLSGFLPDVCCTFGGIWDDVELELCDMASITGLYTVGYSAGCAVTHVRIVNHSKTAERITLKTWYADSSGVEAASGSSIIVMEPDSEGWHQLEVFIANPRVWEPGSPGLYTCYAEISAEGFKAAKECRFGFRDLRADGTAILLNGSPVYLRGLLHWGFYDDIIIPHPSEDRIADEIDKVMAYGFNMVKHCLYIPREEYLRAADEAGLLLWVELPLWLPEATPQLSERIMREYPPILRQLAGHPSVVMLSLGCELDNSVDSTMLEGMYHLARSLSTALIRDNSGSGECYGGLTVDFADYYDYHFYADLQNIENLMEAFTPAWRRRRPWLFGEFCDSDTLRALPMVRAQKIPPTLWWESDSPESNPICGLKPDFRLDKQAERLKKYCMEQDIELLEQLSINHSLMHRKLTVELTRAFPEISGYVITSIRDVPIATSGVFDDMLQPKFNVQEFYRFNADVVLSPAWDLSRTWINADRVMSKERFNFAGGDFYGLHVVVSNYGAADITDPIARWRLCSGDETVASHEAAISKTIKRGEVTELCYVSIKLPLPDRATTLALTVDMDFSGLHARNQWPVFIYPFSDIPSGIAYYDPLNVFTDVLRAHGASALGDGEAPQGCVLVVTSRLTPEIRQWAADGGRVFFLQRGEGYLPVQKVAFWREGIIRNCGHEVMRELEYSWMEDLRYFSLSTDTAFDTAEFDKYNIHGAQPILRRYDCREFTASDYLVEIPFDKGVIVATTLRFEGGMGKQPLSFSHNRLALYLFDRVCKYLLF